MTEQRKPPFVWTTRQPRAADPMFGKTHVAGIRFPVQPTPANDDRTADPEGGRTPGSPAGLTRPKPKVVSGAGTPGLGVSSPHS